MFCCGDVCPVVVEVAEDVIREGEVFLDPTRLLDFVLEAEWTEAPESRGFMSLPLLPWRIKFLSCSRSGAILLGVRKKGVVKVVSGGGGGREGKGSRRGRLR